MGRDRDFVGVIESVYALDAGDEDWLNGLTEAAGRCMHLGEGLVGFQFDLTSGMDRFDFSHAAFHSVPPDVASTVDQITQAIPSEALRVLSTRACATLSQFFADPSQAPGRAYEWFAEHFLPGDCLGVVAINPDGTGICLTTPLPEVTRLPEQTVRRWERLAAHMAAGFRLRLALGPKSGDSAEEASADAVIEPDGRIAHAEDTAKPKTRRERLRHAVRAIERARGGLRRSDPDEAVEIWRGLAAGRWSLIDRFESGGRRYYVAHHNEPAAPGPTTLTDRQRQVVALAALGRSNKLIAYELGLAKSTVGVYLSTAMRKLGIRSRADLIQLASSLMPAPARPRSDGD